MKSSDHMDTDKVLSVAHEFAQDKDIKDVVVASTTGDTGLKAIEIFDMETVNLITVAHSTGFREPNQQEFGSEAMSRIEQAGGKILISPMIFHNLNAAIGEKESFSQGNLVADTLRLFGQGTKVALECVLMACDAGVVDSGKSVISIAGTGRGADTALLIHSSNSKRFFDSRIKEVILKPSELENLTYY